MKRIIALIFAGLVLIAAARADEPRVWLETDLGPIVLELNASAAPVTTANFLDYVDEGFYDGLVFHRTISNFVIQSGGFDADFVHREPTRGPISSEAGNGLLNEPGTIAMALAGGNVNSAQSQFYINLATNSHLDDQGFTVFGKVAAGQAIIDRIAALRTGLMFVGNNQFPDAPVSPPRIRRAFQFEGFPLVPLLTGSWFDPANPGVGFNLEIANDASTEDGPIAIVYWYDFSTGEQIWLTGNAPFEYGASEITLDLISYTGDGEGVDFLTPPPFAEFTVRGQLTLSFQDCRTGTFSYDLPEFGQGVLNVTRLTLPDQASCQDL